MFPKLNEVLSEGNANERPEPQINQAHAASLAAFTSNSRPSPYLQFCDQAPEIVTVNPLF
jgi:hypothetical protein